MFLHVPCNEISGLMGLALLVVPSNEIVFVNSEKALIVVFREGENEIDGLNNGG